ncbi:MAG: biopolymer transporter ExbD [Deltaproteobacteria bacterium]|nr:MAG: biopolymer transporter ExbD [Deltaproteobacteria bacterium]
MNFAARRRAEAVVDVTPLIDIIFQLVLFFMVSTTFVTTPGIEVDLPKSSADVVLKDKSEVRVWVTADGQVLIDDTPVDWEGLRRAFDEAVERDPDSLVIVKADKTVDYGRVVAVMDLARSKGLHRLAIATEAPAAGGGGTGEGDEGSESDAP